MSTESKDSKKFAFVEEVYASLESLINYCEDPETIELFLSHEDNDAKGIEKDRRLLAYYAFYLRAIQQKLDAIDFNSSRGSIQLPSGVTLKVAMALLHMQDLAERVYTETEERATDFAINFLEYVDRVKITLEDYDPWRLSAVPDPAENDESEQDINSSKKRKLA